VQRTPRSSFAIVVLTAGIAAFAWRRQRNERPAVAAFPVDEPHTVDQPAS
jgi:hypothetical protein